MDINKFLQSKNFKIAIACVAVFVALFLVFGLGVYVGIKKADFSFKWAEQYHNNFAGPAGGFLQDLGRAGNQFMESNGVVGKIIQIGGSSITVQGRNDTERIVAITDRTTIKYQNNRIGIENLKIGDEVVIIGSPNQSGQIDAMLIRVMPPAPSANSVQSAPSASQPETQEPQETNSSADLRTN